MDEAQGEWRRKAAIYRSRAEECRILADSFKHERTRITLLSTARTYDRMARQCEEIAHKPLNTESAPD